MRVAVVGGGIAGLTAAFELKRLGAEPVVFEGANQVGGKLRLGELADVTIDVGAEAVLARRPEAIELITEVGLAADLVAPVELGPMIWSHGKLRNLPSTVMGIPRDFTEVADSGILADPVTPRSVPMPTEDVSVGAFVESRLGREVVDRLVEPILGGVYAGQSDKLSLAAAAPMIAALGEDLAGAAAAVVPKQGPMVMGIRGGVGRLPATIIAAGELEVRTSSTVRSVLRVGNSWELVVGPTTSATKGTFDAVVMAAPAPAASRLLAIEAPNAAFALAGVDYASVVVVAFLLEGANLPTASGFLVPPVEDSSVKAATFSSTKWQWVRDRAHGRDVVRVSLGRAGETAVLQQNDEALTALALADLRRMIEPVGEVGQVVASRVQRWGAGLPQYEVGHLQAVRTIFDDVSSVTGLEVCGAAYEGVGIAAVIATARAAARRILAQ